MGYDDWLEQLRIATIAAHWVRCTLADDSLEDSARLMRVAEQQGERAVAAWRTAHPVTAITINERGQ